MPSSVPIAANVTRVLGDANGLRAESFRYSLVSAAALACDVAVYALLLRAGLFAGLAGALGYVAGLCIHYRLSASWVFPDRTGRRQAIPTFAKFAATGVLGLSLTAAIIGAVTGTGLAGPLAAKAVAVVTSYVAVFLLRRAVVFVDHREPMQLPANPIALTNRQRPRA